jgi:hypothetical protein
MSGTPHHSPIKESANQENLHESGSWELMNEEHEGDEDHAMSDRIPTEDTPAKSTRGQLPEDATNPTVVLYEQQRQQTRTPEPKKRQSQRVSVQPSPSTPGRLAPFDWDDFEARYQRALTDADQQETELLEEFEQLVKV